VKYLPLFHHFKAIYQFPKHIIFLVKIVANASLNREKLKTMNQNIIWRLWQKTLTHFVFVNENFSKICQIVIFLKKTKVLHEIHKEKSGGDKQFYPMFLWQVEFWLAKNLLLTLHGSRAVYFIRHRKSIIALTYCLCCIPFTL
jgi:hypothetical protein